VKRLFLNRKGSVLVYVMFSLVFVLIMISIIMNITMSNTNMASKQSDGMQAYYVARSGAEAAYEAILGGTKPSLLVDLKNGIVPPQSTVNFENGTANIIVTTNGLGLTQKILIKSIGTLTGTSISRTVSLEFFADYSNKDMIWSK